MLGLSRHQLTGTHEQVVELERALGRPQVGRFEHPASEDRADQPLAMRAGRLEQPLALVDDGGLAVAQIGERGVTSEVLPLRLVADALRVAEQRRSLGSAGQHGDHRVRRPQLSTTTRPSSATHARPGGRGRRCDSRTRRRAARSAVEGRGATAAAGVRSTWAATRSQFSWKLDGDAPERRVQPEVVEVAELHELDPAGDRAFARERLVEQSIEQIVPALVEGDVALELVEHAESGRQSGGDRELVEQPSGEGVQRSDRGVIERVERGVEALEGEQVGRLAAPPVSS